MQKKDTICVDLELGEGPIPQRLNFVACMIADPLTQTGDGTILGKKKVDGVMKVIVPTDQFFNNPNTTTWTALSMCADGDTWALQIECLQPLEHFMPSTGSKLKTGDEMQRVLEDAEDVRIRNLCALIEAWHGPESAQSFVDGRMPCSAGLCGPPCEQRLLSCSDTSIRDKLLSDGWELHGSTSRIQNGWTCTQTQMDIIQRNVVEHCTLPFVNCQRPIFTRIVAELCDCHGVEEGLSDEASCEKLNAILTGVDSAETDKKMLCAYINALRLQIPSDGIYTPDPKIGICIDNGRFALQPIAGGELMNFLGQEGLDHRILASLYCKNIGANQADLFEERGDCEDFAGKYKMNIESVRSITKQHNKQTLNLSDTISTLWELPRNSEQVKLYAAMIGKIGSSLQDKHCGVPFIAATGASAADHDGTQKMSQNTPGEIFRSTCGAMQGETPTLGGHAAFAISKYAELHQSKYKSRCVRANMCAIPKRIADLAVKLGIKVYAVEKFDALEGTGIVMKEDPTRLSETVVSTEASGIDMIGTNVPPYMNIGQIQSYYSTMLALQRNQLNWSEMNCIPCCVGLQEGFYKGVVGSGPYVYATLAASKPILPRGTLALPCKQKTSSLSSWTSYNLLANPELQKKSNLVCLAFKGAIGKEEKMVLDHIAYNLACRAMTLEESKCPVLSISSMRHQNISKTVEGIYNPYLSEPYMTSKIVVNVAHGNMDPEKMKDVAISCKAVSCSMLNHKSLLLNTPLNLS